MKRVTHEDERGRKYLVEVEDTAVETEYHLYPVIGPPDIVDVLEMPEPYATRLHNALFDRRVYTARDANINNLMGALQSVLKIDAQTLHAAFVNYEKEPE